MASAKPKAAPKAGGKSSAAKKPPALPTSSKDASPKSSVPGTPKRGDIPSFEDAMNAPVESFSASNIVSSGPSLIAIDLTLCNTRTMLFRCSHWSTRSKTRHQ